MLARLLALCGYGKTEDLADFIMTGVAVVPLVVFLGSGIEQAFVLLLVMLVAMFAVFPWLHARGEVQREHEEAQAAAKAAYLRQITGQDR